MAKDKTVYTCTECGGMHAQVAGQVPPLRRWNTLIEGVAEPAGAARNRFASLAPPSEVAVLADIEAARSAHAHRHRRAGPRAGRRHRRGRRDPDRRRPGIGKSTLLLQALDGCSAQACPRST
jgi:DNA repair protein RadA/Sms